MGDLLEMWFFPQVRIELEDRVNGRWLYPRQVKELFWRHGLIEVCFIGTHAVITIAVWQVNHVSRLIQVGIVDTPSIH